MTERALWETRVRVRRLQLGLCSPSQRLAPPVLAGRAQLFSYRDCCSQRLLPAAAARRLHRGAASAGTRRLLGHRHDAVHLGAHEHRAEEALVRGPELAQGDLDCLARGRVGELALQARENIAQHDPELRRAIVLDAHARGEVDLRAQAERRSAVKQWARVSRIRRHCRRHWSGRWRGRGGCWRGHGGERGRRALERGLG